MEIKLNTSNNGYSEIKSIAIESIKRNLVYENHSNENHLNEIQLAHHHYASNFQHSQQHQNYFPNSCNGIEYDTSSLFQKVNDLNCVLNYWSYRFNDIDLVVGIEPNGMLGTLYSQRVSTPFLEIKKKSGTPSLNSNSSATSSNFNGNGSSNGLSTSTDGATNSITEEYGNDNEETLEIDYDVLSTLLPIINSSKKLKQQQTSSDPSSSKFNILIMDDLLENGSCLAAAIELVKKLLNQSEVKQQYKISTAFISSIKSLQGKEKIYEMYNDINVDIINILE